MVDAETFDSANTDDIIDDDTGEKVLGGFCREILVIYKERFPSIGDAWMSIAGIEPGYFMPIAAVPEKLANELPPMERCQASDVAPKGYEIIDSSSPLLWSLPESPQSALAIRLQGHHEYYGICVFCSDSVDYFQGEVLVLITQSISLLNRLVADANFSKRLKTLAAPFDFPTGADDRQMTYNQIVRQACLGLAADGSVLRISHRSDHRSGYNLPVVAQHGLVMEDQMDENGLCERICRAVSDSSSYFVTVQTLRPDGERSGFGATINDHDDSALRKLGIQAYMIMKLQSDVRADGLPTTLGTLGTLAVFHRLPQVFSRRDISLFRGYCERIADDLSLIEQRDENSEYLKIMQAQNSLGNRAELFALLGHDFGHRVIHVIDGLKTFVETCRREARDSKRPTEKIISDGNNLLQQSEDLLAIVRNVRAIGQGSSEPPSQFLLADVFREIERNLALVLERNSIRLDARTEGNSVLVGVKTILIQVFYNLIINAIDAHKESKLRRRNTIHLYCRELTDGGRRRLEIKVWDEGPGISRTAFPDAKQIFDPGATTKPRESASGAGLPVSRSLLHRYFHADLELVNRQQALFQFTIPATIPQSL